MKSPLGLAGAFAACIDLFGLVAAAQSAPPAQSAPTVPLVTGANPQTSGTVEPSTPTTGPVAPPQQLAASAVTAPPVATSAAPATPAQPPAALGDGSVHLAAAVPTNTPAAPPANAAAGKTSPVSVTPYGYIKLAGSYDTARTAYGDLAFYVQPASRPGGGSKELVFSGRESRLGLKLGVPGTHGIVPTGQLEADWFEEAATPGKYSPRLRLAFIDLALGQGWSVRAGQDWDLFVSVHPLVTDPGILGGTGHLYGRRPQVRVSKVVNFNATDTVAFKVAATHGRSQDVDGDGQIDAEAAGVPTVQGSILFSLKLLGKKPTTLQLSGAYGREKLRLPVATATVKPSYDQTFESTLAHAGLVLPLSDALSVQGTVFWGKNLDQYWGGIIQGINIAEGRSVQSVGGWAQVVAEVVSGLTITGGYGADNPKDADVAASGRTSNSRIFGNAFIKITPETTIALEYGYLATYFASEAKQHSNRIAAGLQYNF